MRLITTRALTAAVIGAGLAGCHALAQNPDAALRPTVPSDAITTGVRDGQTTLGLGQILSIALPSNGSTGYSWHLEGFDEGVLTRGEPFGTEVTNPHPAGMVGVPGETRWQFKAASRGQTTLVFSYRRPWDPSTAPAETARYTVTVR